jgi:hypothetical protein
VLTSLALVTLIAKIALERKTRRDLREATGGHYKPQLVGGTRS